MIICATVSNMSYADQTALNFASQINAMPDSLMTTGTDGTMTGKNNWTHVKANNRPAKGATGTRYNVRPTNALTAVDITPLGANAAMTEFWVRCGMLIDSVPSTAAQAYINYTILEIRGADLKILARLVSTTANTSTRNFTWEVLDPVTQAVTASKLVATITTTSYPADANANQAIDFRVMLDPVAGFVQAYNSTGQLISETLGTTCPVAQRAYIGLHYPMGFTDFERPYSLCFTIVSTTTTFGMLAIPLFAKAAGTKNDALAGDYTVMSQWLTKDTLPTPLKLEAATGESKQFDFKCNNLADIGMPANYKLDAVMLRATNTAVNADGAVVQGKLTMSLDGVTFYDTVAPIVPNVELQGGKFQTRAVVYNTNPATSAAWQVSDLTNFYVGMKLER